MYIYITYDIELFSYLGPRLFPRYNSSKILQFTYQENSNYDYLLLIDIIEYELLFISYY